MPAYIISLLHIPQIQETAKWENRQGRFFLGGRPRSDGGLHTRHTCLSVKWYWHSFFHSSRSSLSTWRSGATWPRLTRSLPSLSLCMMFNCKHNGRSVKVVPLKAGLKRKTDLSFQEAENQRNPSLQHSYCFFKTSHRTKQQFLLLNKGDILHRNIWPSVPTVWDNMYLQSDN